VHSIAEKSQKKLWKATKTPTIKIHVAVERNISNVVANKLASPDKIRGNASFSFYQKIA